MRTRQPEITASTKARTAVAEPVSRPRPAARHGQTGRALLALQRGHGNRYVQRLMAGRSGTGLEPGTRERLERAFGTDLSTVTVTHRPEVAAIGALACTRGEHIVLGPAQRLDTAAGQELLAHEVAHVVQQRQGRVRPRVEVGGVEFNADTGLEAEADAAAHRVSAGGPAGMTAPDTAAPGTVAQGKFGFEFETRNNFVTAGEAAVVPEKGVAYEDPAMGFRIEADEGSDAAHTHVEFVTDATDSVETAIKSAAAAADLALELGRHAEQFRDPDSESHPVITPSGGHWKRPVAIEVTNPDFRATIQGSVGVGMESIYKLMTANLGSDELPVLQGMIKDVWSADTNIQRRSLFGFLSLLTFYVKRAGGTNDRADAPKDQSRHWVKVEGENQWQQMVTDGPKAMFSVMARTDFHSIYEALPQDDQRAFLLMLANPEHRAESSALARAFGRTSLTEKLFTDPYRADPRLNFGAEDRARLGIKRGTESHTGDDVLVVTKGPSILDWLISIANGYSYFSDERHPSARDEARKDMLSAPPGYGTVPAGVGFAPSAEQIVQHSIYGMGAYRMDPDSGGLAVFEIRNLSYNLMAEGYTRDAVEWAAIVKHALSTYLAAGVRG